MKPIRLAIGCLSGLIALASTVPQALACTPTGFVRDGINLTAALINPKGTVTGDVNGTGCNIVVYYGPGAIGMVNGAHIHSANYFGVVNNGAIVTIQGSSIYDIGDTPLDGDQHGVAIYFAYESKAQGTISTNVIWNYQKGGIVVNGPLAYSNVQYNTVIGQGPVNYIAQNGIQFGFGAQGTIADNTVTGNSYTGAGQTASGGIVLIGGACYGGATQTGITVQQNLGVGNDVGVWFSNLDINCDPVLIPTRDQAIGNTLSNNAVNNTTGDGAAGYQAGISDQGDGDTIKGNSICGIGYTPVTPPPYLYAIDVTDTNHAVVESNTSCGPSEFATVSAGSITAAVSRAQARPTVIQ
jgi:hypothetical protein